MTFTFYQEIIAFFPEFFFGVSLCIFLLFSSFFSTFNYTFINKTLIFQKASFWVSIQVLFYTLVLTLNNSSQFIIIFQGCLVYDQISFIGKILILISTIFIIIGSSSYQKNNSIFTFEFQLIFLISVFAILLIIDSTDLISFYLALELQALSFYILATYKKDSAFSTEAGVKYFIIGAFSSGFFLFGSSMIQGFSGTTNFQVIKDLFFFEDGFSQEFFYLYFGFCFIFISFLFKIGAAPFHIWIPDVQEGSPITVSFFFSCVPKITLVFCFSRFIFLGFSSFYFIWQPLCLITCLFCFFVGSLGSIVQRKIKRFLVFSSIGHLGFILLGLGSNSIIGLQAVIMYVIIQVIISISSWVSILSFFQKKRISIRFLDELEGIYFENPAFIFFLVCLFFSIAGIPPFSGFFIKLFVFFSAIDSLLFFVSIIIVFFSVITCFYYLRLVKGLSYTSSYKNDVFKSNYIYSSLTKNQAILLSTNLYIISLFCFFPNFLYIITHKISLYFFI